MSYRFSNMTLKTRFNSILYTINKLFIKHLETKNFSEFCFIQQIIIEFGIIVLKEMENENDEGIWKIEKRIWIRYV